MDCWLAGVCVCVCVCVLNESSMSIFLSVYFAMFVTCFFAFVARTPRNEILKSCNFSLLQIGELRKQGSPVSRHHFPDSSSVGPSHGRANGVADESRVGNVILRRLVFASLSVPLLPFEGLGALVLFLIQQTIAVVQFHVHVEALDYLDLEQGQRPLTIWVIKPILCLVCLLGTSGEDRRDHSSPLCVLLLSDDEIDVAA